MIGLVGDVVGSRQFPDQNALLAGLSKVLSAVNLRRNAEQALQITIGDEFQAAYLSRAEAIGATLEIRLRLGPTIRVRFGIGEGEMISLDPKQLPLAQSGSAWWRAREALDQLMQSESRRRWPRSAATRLLGEGSEDEDMINAMLILRDQILDRMDEKDCRIGLALLLGSNQDEVARELEIGQPSVSRRQMENGPIALYRAQQLLDGAA